MSLAHVTGTRPETGAFGQKRYQKGSFAFSTTDLTGNLPMQLRNVEQIFFNVANPSTATDLINLQLGTISASSTFRYRVRKAGTISGINLTVGTTVATDAANIWTIGVINKGAAGAGTAVVVNIATAANSNNSTGGAAFTANVPRALTLGLAAALVVAAGDVLEITFTKAASAADLVTANLDASSSTTEVDETVRCTETRGTNGGINVGSDGVIAIARKTGSGNPVSGQVVDYLAIGF